MASNSAKSDYRQQIRSESEVQIADSCFKAFPHL